MKKKVDYITATEARKNLFSLIEQTTKQTSPINITMNGIPVAVLMSKDEYESWEATVETISDPEIVEAIRESGEDIKAGRYTSWDLFKKELGLDKEELHPYMVAEKKANYVSNRNIKKNSKRHTKTG